jgi:C4-type Zn-finger protein
MVSSSDRIDIGERVYILSTQKIGCPVCGNEASLIISEYRSLYETLIIITLRCSNCGYKKAEVIPIIEEDEYKCIEVKVENVEDLKTLVFIPPGSSIEIPEFEVKLELAELSDIVMGNYVTVDGILLDIADNLEKVCIEAEQGLDVEKCVNIVNTLRRSAENPSTPITVRVISSVGNIRIVRSYRNNFKKC